MIITGYDLIGAISNHELIRDSLAEEFDDSLAKYEDESKRKPSTVSDEFILTEASIAKLQAAQVYYNASVTVGTVKDLFDFAGAVTLCMAIKFYGGLRRHARMWKAASSGGKQYRGFLGLRTDDTMREDPTVTREHALGESLAASHEVSLMKAAIARANAVKIEIDWLTPEDLAA